MKQIKIEKDGWCRCGKCGHKLFAVKNKKMEILLEATGLEIKCHSCKEINSFEGGNKNDGEHCNYGVSKL